MKKLLLLSFLATIVITVTGQIRPGRYKIMYTQNDLLLQEKSEVEPRLIIDNKPETGFADVWDVKQVPGRPRFFYIQNVASKKCITWSSPTAGDPQGVNVILRLTALLPLRDMQKQSFRFESPKDGFVQMLADNGVTTGYNMYALGTSSAIGPNSNIVCVNITGIDEKYFTWLLTPVQQIRLTETVKTPVPKPAAIERNDNKIEIDFKTGGDNLEPKGFQKNLQLTIKIKNRASIVMDDVNKNQTWPNNSIRRVVVPLPADINVMDLESIMLIRTVVSNFNNFDAGVADNWNLDKITATAIVKTDGRMVRTLLLNQSGTPLFRFIYEGRGNTNPNAGLGQTFAFAPGRYGTPTVPGGSNNMAAITAVFGTGGDNLEGGNGNNVNIIIKFKSKTQVVTISNVNNKANWGNFTENTVTKTIPNSASLDINDIKEVELWHTGGGGMFADNWHIDKFKLTISNGRETKVLVDRVGAPIHMFTGDTRRKTFIVE